LGVIRETGDSRESFCGANFEGNEVIKIEPKIMKI
jgi:hypothetical protein